MSPIHLLASYPKSGNTWVRAFLTSLHFPEIDAVFENVRGAVRVTQRGRSYLARKRQLNDRLEKIIRTAILHGYTCFWVEGHPSTPYLVGGDRYAKGSHHIYTHPKREGHLSVPHPKSDLGKGLVHKLRKQAGLK